MVLYVTWLKCAKLFSVQIHPRQCFPTLFCFCNVNENLWSSSLFIWCSDCLHCNAHIPIKPHLHRHCWLLLLLLFPQYHFSRFLSTVCPFGHPVCHSWFFVRTKCINLGRTPKNFWELKRERLFKKMFIWVESLILQLPHFRGRLKVEAKLIVVSLRMSYRPIYFQDWKTYS